MSLNIGISADRLYRSFTSGLVVKVVDCQLGNHSLIPTENNESLAASGRACASESLNIQGVQK